MNKTKLNKAVALFCLTGFIVGGGSIIHPHQTSANEEIKEMGKEIIKEKAKDEIINKVIVPNAEKLLEKALPNPGASAGAGAGASAGGASAGADAASNAGKNLGKNLENAAKGMVQSVLSSAIIGMLPGIPIGSTVSYKWTPSGLGGYAVCAVSEKNPEADDTQNAKCFFGVPGGWAVPPIKTDTRHFEYGGSEVQTLNAITLRWHGHHLSWGSVTAEVHNDVYQGTSGLASGGLWGDSDWGNNQYGWGSNSYQRGKANSNLLSSGKAPYNGRENLSDFGIFNGNVNDHTGALDIKGGAGLLPWNSNGISNGSGSGVNGSGGLGAETGGLGTGGGINGSGSNGFSTTDGTFNGGSGGGAFGDIINDALNDRGGSFNSNGKSGSYKPGNASSADWASSGTSGGTKNLDNYFNSGGYPSGVDSISNMPGGLTNDLFGFDTKPVSPPSWFDSSQFLDQNGNIKPEIMKQMQNENFWLNGKEPGTINGQQMWDFYENAAGMGAMSGVGLYDQNGNPIDGFFDANGKPIEVFFDANGNFVDANGNPIKVYDRYGNEITGLFGKDGKRINGALFKDVNGDGVVDIKDIIQQLAEKDSLMAKLSGEDGLQAVLDSIFGDDNSLNKTVQGTLSIQDMYAIAKQVLLNAGFDIDDIMNGRNYSEGSAYTDPSDAWDFNRITTLMKARKITPVTPDEIREHQEERRKALAKKGIGGFGMPLSDPVEQTIASAE